MLYTLSTRIQEAWEGRADLSHFPSLKEEIHSVFRLLEQGIIRVCEKKDGTWVIYEWIKKAILLSFQLFPNRLIEGGYTHYWDKIPLQGSNWTSDEFQKASFRLVPGAIVRASAYIAPHVILMPTFVNVGAYIGEKTMIDSWATVGSCAQIGASCHISEGVCIGGVLEPLQAQPVIIEDNCFVGARSAITEGIKVEQGSVIATGVFLGASTKIIDRETGEVFKGFVPSYSVVVPGVAPSTHPLHPSLACAVIVKRVDAKTREKVAINQLLRESVDV